MPDALLRRGIIDQLPAQHDIRIRGDLDLAALPPAEMGLGEVPHLRPVGPGPGRVLSSVGLGPVDPYDRRTVAAASPPMTTGTPLETVDTLPLEDTRNAAGRQIA